MVTASKDGTWRVWNINVRYHQQEDPKTLLQHHQEVMVALQCMQTQRLLWALAAVQACFYMLRLRQYAVQLFSTVSVMQRHCGGLKARQRVSLSLTR